MEKKHDLTFCPECGVKLLGDEFVCSVCGFRLAEPPVTPPPPSVPETVIVPPVPETPAVAFCPNCGAKIEEHEIFCNDCGSRLTIDQDQQPIDNAPPPPVIEVPIILPPVIVETPAVPPATVIPPPASPVVETPMVSFCSNCGAKNDANEIFCNGCGTRLSADSNQKPDNTPAPPKVETPIVPPVVQNVPPVTQQAYTPQPLSPEPLKKKKGMGVFMWILIIFLTVLIIGGGTVAFLQYNGTVNVPFLAKFIPSKETSNINVQPEVVTNYYIVRSFTAMGKDKWDAIVSCVIVSKQKNNNTEGAINQFNKAVMKKYPKDSYKFTNSALCESYKTLAEAQSAHSSLLKSYNEKKYIVRCGDLDVRY